MDVCQRQRLRRGAYSFSSRSLVVVEAEELEELEQSESEEEEQEESESRSGRGFFLVPGRRWRGWGFVLVVLPVVVVLLAVVDFSLDVVLDLEDEVFCEGFSSQGLGRRSGFFIWSMRILFFLDMR